MKRFHSKLGMLFSAKHSQVWGSGGVFMNNFKLNEKILVSQPILEKSYRRKF